MNFRIWLIISVIAAIISLGTVIGWGFIYHAIILNSMPSDGNLKVAAWISLLSCIVGWVTLIVDQVIEGDDFEPGFHVVATIFGFVPSLFVILHFSYGF